MKKIEKIKAQLDEVKQQLQAVSFERKDISYRRKGGYFGTYKAQTDDVIIINSFLRTKHLRTYICVDKSFSELVANFNKLQIEHTNQFNKQYERESIKEAIEVVNRDIETGVIHTNYGKRFIVGNKNIYYAHPVFKHEDYNKWCAMPNTPMHRRIAEELNKKIEASIHNAQNQQP